MIQFFRKIRQRLLAENRVNKYLLYAVGEIILVVIGILIALQINNYNQKGIDQKYERTMLAEIKSALEKDISNIESQLLYLDKLNISATKLVTMKDDETYPQDSLMHHFTVVRKGGTGLSINSSPYESLKSSGLDRITNAKLRNNISYLYEIKMAGIQFWVNDFIKRILYQRDDLVREIFQMEFSVDSSAAIKTSYKVDHKKLYRHPKSDQFLYLSTSYINLAKKRLGWAIGDLKELAKEIEDELEK